jgi:hypothetical protein
LDFIEPKLLERELYNVMTQAALSQALKDAKVKVLSLNSFIHSIYRTPEIRRDWPKGMPSSYALRKRPNSSGKRRFYWRRLAMLSVGRVTIICTHLSHPIRFPPWAGQS